MAPVSTPKTLISGFDSMEFPLEHVQPTVTPPAKLLKGYRNASNLHKYKITKRNATNSPLLNLPPELRNKIYTHVLGNETVHINRPTRYNDWDHPNKSRYHMIFAGRTVKTDITYTLCHINGHDDGCAADSIRETRSEHKTFDYARYHRVRGCDTDRRTAPRNWNTLKRQWKRPERLAFQFLRTCKQVHHEAALLPYLLNHFTFDDGDTFAMFINSLIPTQKRAIQTVTFNVGQWQRFCIPLEALETMKGLRDVTVFGRFRERGDVYEATAEEFERSLVMLRRVGVEKARLCFTPFYGDERKRSVTVKDVREWYRESERKIERMK